MIRLVDPRVRRRLEELSKVFYAAHADSFDDTRVHPWDSWKRVLNDVRQLTELHGVLDVGCGNGRFASFLDNNDLAGIVYTGIDIEARLIDKARERYPQKRFRVQSLEGVLQSDETFGLVTCFGVFHHLPGEEHRAAISKALGRLLRSGGVLAMSLWQPKMLHNFDLKVFHEHDISGLEDNDFLMGWRNDFSRLRYCHHFDDDEIDRLVSQSGLNLITQYQGIGNDLSNRYVVLQRTD